MVGNFREVILFAFLASREQLAKIKFAKNFLRLRGMNDVSSSCYFKLPSSPNSNRSLSVSVPLMAITQAHCYCKR